MNEKDLEIFDVSDIKGILSAALSEENEDDERIKENNLSQWGIVDFTKEEINTMPKNFKRLLILNEERCRLRTRKSGKNGTTYEIRFRRRGYEVNACGKTIDEAKKNFLAKLKTATPNKKEKGGGHRFPETFSAYALYYFETFRKGKVSERHYKNSLYLLNRFLFPRLSETPLKKITPSDCKAILDEVKNSGKGKTADDLFSIFNGIFKNAIAHGIIDRNPLALVPHDQHEKENGVALSRAEEETLLNAVKFTTFALPVALALFCGLRPNELSTAQIKGDFIKAVNSKRKNGKTEYKLIPIINRLRPFLPDGGGTPEGGGLVAVNLDMLRRTVRNALPTHKLYDLRTTFYTRCDEMGVAPPARDEFVGHSSGILTNTYRDLSEEYLLKEGAKLNLW